MPNINAVVPERPCLNTRFRFRCHKGKLQDVVIILMPSLPLMTS